MDREEFEDTVLASESLFAQYAMKYVKAEVELQSFLDWAWEYYQRSIQPVPPFGVIKNDIPKLFKNLVEEVDRPQWTASNDWGEEK